MTVHRASHGPAGHHFAADRSVQTRSRQSRPVASERHSPASLSSNRKPLLQNRNTTTSSTTSCTNRSTATARPSGSCSPPTATTLPCSTTSRDRPPRSRCPPPGPCRTRSAPRCPGRRPPADLGPHHPAGDRHRVRVTTRSVTHRTDRKRPLPDSERRSRSPEIGRLVSPGTDRSGNVLRREPGVGLVEGAADRDQHHGRSPSHGDGRSPGLRSVEVDQAGDHRDRLEPGLRGDPRQPCRCRWPTGRPGCRCWTR